MRRLPPRSTRTDTLVPYTKRFRSLDHAQQKTVDLSGMEILILDEADRMLDMGFIRDIRRILALLPKTRQRSEEHTSELQSLMRTSYAGFCLKKNKHTPRDETAPIQCEQPAETRNHSR